MKGYITVIYQRGVEISSKGFPSNETDKIKRFVKKMEEQGFKCSIDEVVKNGGLIKGKDYPII